MDVSTLQLGDFVIKKEGLSKRKICKVVQIHAKSLCVKSIDGGAILNEPSFLAFIDAFEPIPLTGSFLELNGFIPQTSGYTRSLFEDGITSIDDVWTLWKNDELNIIIIDDRHSFQLGNAEIKYVNQLQEYMRFLGLADKANNLNISEK